MAKFKKDGGKKKKNNNKTFAKKKVKVGRVIKKANETIPQAKVGKIVIKSQFVKADNDVLKIVSSPHGDVDLSSPPHSSLVEIKMKIIAELKKCSPDVKADDKKKFLHKVTKLIQETHYNLSTLMFQVVLEKICCPLMYDRSDEVRTEIPDLLRCIISRSMKALNMEGIYPITAQTCPIITTCLCRSLIDTSFCPESLKVLDVLCEFCPKLIQSDSLNILHKLLAIMYRQTYFQMENCAGELKPRNWNLDVNKLSAKTYTCSMEAWSQTGLVEIYNPTAMGSMNRWSLPRLIDSCSSTLLTKPLRQSVIERITKVFTILSPPSGGIRCEYLAHPGNVMDDEEKCREIAEVCFEILCAAWNDIFSHGSKSTNSEFVLNSETFYLCLSILSCLKATLEFVRCNSIFSDFVSWMNSKLRTIFDDSLLRYFPYIISRRSNKKNTEIDDSSAVNGIVKDLKTYFSQPS